MTRMLAALDSCNLLPVWLTGLKVKRKFMGEYLPWQCTLYNKFEYYFFHAKQINSIRRKNQIVLLSVYLCMHASLLAHSKMVETSENNDTKNDVINRNKNFHLRHQIRNIILFFRSSSSEAGTRYCTAPLCLFGKSSFYRPISLLQSSSRLSEGVNPIALLPYSPSVETSEHLYLKFNT